MRIAIDKWKHIKVGDLISLALGFPIKGILQVSFGLTDFLLLLLLSAFISWLAGTGIGIGYEYYQKWFDKGNPEKWDAIATSLGAGNGAGQYMIIALLVEVLDLPNISTF